MKSDCSICEELKGRTGTNLSSLLETKGIRNAIFSSNDDFVIIPSIGPLIIGHSLLVTKNHECGIFTSINQQKLENMYSILKTFIKMFPLTNSISKPTFLCFEHGTTVKDPARVHCSTIHAHLHLVPLESATLKRINEDLKIRGFKNFSTQKILQNAFFGDYIIVFQANEGDLMAECLSYQHDNIESQLLRKIIAHHLDIVEWNWQKSSNVEDLLNTIHLGFKTNNAVVCE